MAQKSYKVNEAIEVVYQAPNAATGITVNMEIYDEVHALVAGGPIVLTELGATGRYYGPFTPDTVGEWSVQIEVSDGTGKVTKAYSVGSHHLQDVGVQADAIKTDTATIDTAVGVIDGKINTIDTEIAAVDAKVVDLDADVVAIDTKITDLDADIVVIDGKIDGLNSPPMIG